MTADISYTELHSLIVIVDVSYKQTSYIGVTLLYSLPMAEYAQHNPMGFKNKTYHCFKNPVLKQRTLYGFVLMSANVKNPSTHATDPLNAAPLQSPFCHPCTTIRL